MAETSEITERQAKQGKVRGMLGRAAGRLFQSSTPDISDDQPSGLGQESGVLANSQLATGQSPEAGVMSAASQNDEEVSREVESLMNGNDKLDHIRLFPDSGLTGQDVINTVDQWKGQQFTMKPEIIRPLTNKK
jgi:hypothetical protein